MWPAARNVRRHGARPRGVLAAALAASGLALALVLGVSGPAAFQQLFRENATRPQPAANAFRRVHRVSPVVARHSVAAATRPAAETIPPISEAPTYKVEVDPLTGMPDVSRLPKEMGVYAVYDQAGKLRYIGLSRQIDKSIEGHATFIGASEAGKLISSVRIAEMPGQSKEELKAAWERWIKEHTDAGGAIPPGNLPESSPAADTRWRIRASQAREPLKLGGYRGPRGAVEAVRTIVKSHPIVIFMKGTPSMPQCGFSARSVGVLNQLGVAYESVNVLDNENNPGIRDAVKEYSKWPTIPQLFVNGELVGGADIISEMFANGQLEQVVRAAAPGAPLDNTAGSSAPAQAREVPRGEVMLIQDARRPTASAISRALNSHFRLHTLRIVDESRQHSGHAGVKETGTTGESNFRVEIVAPEFAGLTPVQRQQRVYQALSEVMPRIHALSLVTRTPEELLA